LVACHIDGAPACAEHSRKCRSCQQPHCSAHEGTCDESGHPACTKCLVACAHCGRLVCDRHAKQSHVNAPKGSRRLCSNCVRTCEGGTGEVVGPDEVTGCASCDRVVCERHQARCDVDKQVHCSSHLRRADRSRRLVCERDRATCIHEPNAILASDEVVLCATCGGSTCPTHSAACVVDGLRHCSSHLAPVRDRPGQVACGSHQSVCHVDGGVFTRDGTTSCPVCGRLACRQHRQECNNCGRLVCSQELRAPTSRVCATCTQLKADDPSDAVIAAAVRLRGADAKSPKGWKVARDARHVVVEMDLGWTRRLVISVPHGDSSAQNAVSHSALGRKVVRA
jgi:hypothetical protein